MKRITFLHIFSSVIVAASVAGCVVAPPPQPRYAPPPAPVGYVAPIPPPAGVTVVAPIGVAPGPGWGWAYHPHYGWGWHHPGYGWRHRYVLSVLSSRFFQLTAQWYS